jgi:hypothetical protein
MRRRVAQGAADKEAQMFERSEFLRFPPVPSNAACPQGRRIRLAFLLGTLLWRSKEKDLGRRAETRPACASELYLKHEAQSVSDNLSLKQKQESK